ncbi:thiamine-phosphate kinase [Cyanobium sp. CH-040]|uniref:thiamine-phosphate kinase n=1 Tax=Cyanobium sp. CH-040 TaxID=2823708 RepID=UPI0020CFBC76|nr:thiamine-phosphate kinase [Cyanobium sp. CH-040]MCP9927126.1 thiamine-phosphate kinase [Cyanobium sp. CH-040]
MTPAEGPSLADLGEWELIERLAAFAPPGQFSDDAALVDLPGPLVVNTDVLVEQVHFSDASTSGFDVGWRAAAANLSDLAAMGCSSVCGLTVGLVAPGSTPWSWVEAVYTGLRACLDSHGGQLLGGDCSSGTLRLLAVTALGGLARTTGGDPAPIRRGDGKPGDRLVSTGPHGLSRLGLAVLLGALPEGLARGLEPSLLERAIAAHQRPRPRLDAVAALHASRPRNSLWRVGGTDSSDGLAAAAEAIARSSGCRALLDRRRLPLDPGMAALPEALDWCLGGGEDFELILALEAAWAEALVARLPGAQIIGELAERSQEGRAIGWLGDAEAFPASAAGFTHFQLRATTSARSTTRWL